MTPSHDGIKGNDTADPAVRMVLNIFLGEDQNQQSHLNKMATALEYHHTENVLRSVTHLRRAETKTREKSKRMSRCHDKDSAIQKPHYLGVSGIYIMPGRVYTEALSDRVQRSPFH